MNKWRLTKLLVVAAAGLALAAGTVAAVASTRDGDSTAQRSAAQEETPDENARPWLGVLVRPSDQPAGLAVRHVAQESPAADAGLERGDVITAIDGQAVSDFDALAAAIEAKAVGDTVTLSVVKNGVDEPDVEATDVEATLVARPDRAGLKERIGEGIGKAFDRFVDGQFRYLDEEGNTVSVEVVAGTVSSISDTQITIDVNGDDEGERSFDIPDGVDVPEGLAQGDGAAVVIKDGAVEHILPGGFPLPLPGLVPNVFPGADGGFKLPFGGEGDAMSVEVISGTVSSVSTDEITLDLGDDQGEKSFSIPDGVEVPEGLEAGEQATVVVHDGEVAKIHEGAPPTGEFKFPFDGEFFPHPFRGPGAPFEEPAAEPQEAAPEA
ncbi:MAG TPA: PDZ domain-containing protein [Dehalococcoidia bacterium]|jgi:membrane-associated protease RseP (regulator of RpoE activity)|nr:PDZ domain-containing protein [Dehalococcoidia bacterium]